MGTEDRGEVGYLPSVLCAISKVAGMDRAYMLGTALAGWGLTAINSIWIQVLFGP